MKPPIEQKAAALAKARGITLAEARRLVEAATQGVTVKPPKGH
jgi:hypothetical protein